MPIPKRSFVVFLNKAAKINALWLYFLCFWCIQAFVACQNKQVEQPTLADEKLAQIMADLCIADAATNGLAGYPKDSLMHAYFDQVFQLHGVSAETYEKDLRIIAQDLPHMDRIVKMADNLLLEDPKKLESGAPK